MRDLLNRKLQCFMDIKRITESYNFKGTEEESDDYISMVDKREYILNKIKDIDILLSEQGTLNSDADLALKNQIKKVVKEIIDLDKKNKPCVEKIRQNILLKINGMKKGTEVASAYNQYMESSGFDSKR